MKYNLRCIEDIDEFIEDLKKYLKTYHVNEEKYWDIILCLREGINNAFLHGNAQDSGQVTIIWEIQKNEFAFWIHDGGDAIFVPSEIESKDPLSEHGRGLLLMQELLDEMYFAKGAVGGRLTI